MSPTQELLKSEGKVSLEIVYIQSTLIITFEIRRGEHATNPLFLRLISRGAKERAHSKEEKEQSKMQTTKDYPSL